MSEEPEPDGYFYPNGNVELQKGWQLGQKALFAATRPTSLQQVTRAKDLAKEALLFLQPHTNPTDQYFTDNAAIIIEFGRVLQILRDMDAGAVQASEVGRMDMLWQASIALENFKQLDKRYFFYDIKANYNPFTVHTPSSKQGRKPKKKKQDWRDELWIDEVDEKKKDIYGLRGNDGIYRFFNEDNVLVQQSDDGNWYSEEQYDVGPRWKGEQLYADDRVRMNYGLPDYNDRQQEAIYQWVQRRREKASRQSRGEPSYFHQVAVQQQAQQSHQVAAQQHGHHAGPSWYAGPRRAWGRYKSRRVKIPRQRRKTIQKNRKNRKNKTNRKK